MIALRTDGCGPDYFAPLLDRDTDHMRGISIRRSIRWIDAFPTPNGGLNVPFIDTLGRITGFTFCKWSCDPRSLIATVVSTISKRLIAYARRHNPWHIVKSRLKDILEASAYYAFSKNGYYWDRVLYFARNLLKCRSAFRSLRIYFSSKWDDQKRFVYSHVIFQTKWLLFRALGPRDKSHLKQRPGKTDFSDEVRFSRSIVSNKIREIAYAISCI